eukprot:346826-Karenia_brevis.AAC.1
MYRPEDDDKDFMCDHQANPTFNPIDLRGYRDKSFPLEDREDDFEMCLVIDVDMDKIFPHLGGTPTPLGIVPDAKALVPHTMEMDPSDGKMEDDLYGLLDHLHSDTAETIKRKGRLAQL